MKSVNNTDLYWFLNPSSDIESSIAARIKRLLNATTVDVETVPIDNLDAHLGTPIIKRAEEDNAVRVE